VTLNNCGVDSDDKFAEILRGDSTNTFTCSQLGGATTLTWNIKSGTNEFTIYECNATGCTNSGNTEAFSASWTQSNTENVMTIKPQLLTNKDFVSSYDLVCGIPQTTQRDSCPMDYVSTSV
jgi:hypothetical protein